MLAVHDLSWLGSPSYYPEWENFLPHVTFNTSANDYYHPRKIGKIQVLNKVLGAILAFLGSRMVQVGLVSDRLLSRLSLVNGRILITQCAHSTRLSWIAYRGYVRSLAYSPNRYAGHWVTLWLYDLLCMICIYHSPRSLMSTVPADIAKVYVSYFPPITIA